MTSSEHGAVQAPRDVGGLRGLTRPSTLAPVELDLRRVLWVGIAVWAAALVTTAVVTLTDRAEPRLVAICAAGVALGFVGLAWERRRRARERSAPEPSAATGPEPR